MPVNEYSTDPDANTEIGGIDVGEGCAPGNINNAIRRMMADVADGLVQFYSQSKTNAQRLIARQNIGLGNVNNTSDADKPVSLATQTALNGKVNNNDNRLTNAREWTANTVSPAEARAGTENTRRAWTALRVRQAIRALAIGEGQAWVNVTGSRNSNTVYQNTTGRSIEVLISVTNHPIVFLVGQSTGSLIRLLDGEYNVNISAVIPAGHYYEIRFDSGSAGYIKRWSELR